MMLSHLLEGYEEESTKFLCEGLSEGFKIPHRPFKFVTQARNHPSALANPQAIDKILQNELSLGRIAGPFEYPPYQEFHLSPLGLVPKPNGTEFRIIHDLSFPFAASLNFAIPEECKTVSYDNLETAINIILELGPDSLIAKADIEQAYRIIPIHPSSVPLLGFVRRDRYYFDFMLPFGLALSFQYFEKFSCAIQWILHNKYSVPHISHIIDDFIFFLALVSPNSAMLHYVPFFT